MILQPRIEMTAAAWSAGEIHEPAGARCSIARSVNLPVRCEARDLCHVSSIDAAYLEPLRELTTRRVALTVRSPYLDEILKDVADVDR
jgi:hypothetical protein